VQFRVGQDDIEEMRFKPYGSNGQSVPTQLTFEPSYQTYGMPLYGAIVYSNWVILLVESGRELSKEIFIETPPDDGVLYCSLYWPLAGILVPDCGLRSASTAQT